MTLTPETPDSPSDPRRLKRRITLGLILFAAVVLVASVAGSFSPACSACHHTQASGLSAGAHAGIACYDCHLENGAWGFLSAKSNELAGMYPRTLLGGKPTRPAAQTTRDACLRCHEDVLGRVVSASGLNIAHDSCAAGVSCDTCHSMTAHGDGVRFAGVPVMEDCTTCHTSRGASIECETCHGAESGPRSTTPTPWRVTHGTTWQSTHGMGELSSCRVCHPKGFCTRCHGVEVPHTPDFGTTHGKLAIADRAACMRCHTSETFCSACHGIEMPHPASFLKEHPTAIKDRNDPSCQRCHAPGDCAACHENHVHPGGGKGMPIPWTATDESLRAEESK